MKSRFLILIFLTFSFFLLIGADCVGNGDDNVQEATDEEEDVEEDTVDDDLIEVSKKLVPTYTLKTELDELKVFVKSNYENGGNPLWHIIKTPSPTSNAFTVHAGKFPIFSIDFDTYNFDVIRLYEASDYSASARDSFPNNTTPVWQYSISNSSCVEVSEAGSGACLDNNVIYGTTSGENDTNSSSLPDLTNTELDNDVSYVVFAFNQTTGVSSYCEFKPANIFVIDSSDSQSNEDSVSTQPNFKLSTNRSTYTDCNDSDVNSTLQTEIKEIIIIDDAGTIVWRITPDGADTIFPTNTSITYKNTDQVGSFDVDESFLPPTELTAGSTYYIYGLASDNTEFNGDDDVILGLRKIVVETRPDDNIGFFNNLSGLTPFFDFTETSFSEDSSVKKINIYNSSDIIDDSYIDIVPYWTIEIDSETAAIPSNTFYCFTTSSGSDTINQFDPSDNSTDCKELLDGFDYRAVAFNFNGYAIGHSTFTAEDLSDYFLITAPTGVRPRYEVNTTVYTAQSYDDLKVFENSEYLSNINASPVFFLCSGTDSNCDGDDNKIPSSYLHGNELSDLFYDESDASILTEGTEYRAIAFDQNKDILGFKVFTVSVSTDFIEILGTNTATPEFTIPQQIKTLSIFDRLVSETDPILSYEGDPLISANTTIEFGQTPSGINVTVTGDLNLLHFGEYRAAAYDELGTLIGYTDWQASIDNGDLVSVSGGLEATLDHKIRADSVNIVNSGDGSVTFALSCSGSYLPLSFDLNPLTGCTVFPPNGNSLDDGVFYNINFSYTNSSSVSQELTKTFQAITNDTEIVANSLFGLFNTFPTDTEIVHGITPSNATLTYSEGNFEILDSDTDYVVAGFLDGAEIEAVEFSVFKTDEFISVQVGSENDDFVNKIAMDSEGNIYLAGITNGFFVEPDDGVALDSEDGLILRFDNEYSQDWVQQPRTSGSDTIEAMEVFGDYLFIAGTSNREFEGIENSGNKDIFVQVRNKSNGSLIKTLYFGSEEGLDDIVTGISVEETNDIYLTGYSTLDGSDTSWGSNVTGFSEEVLQDAFVTNIQIDYSSTNDLFDPTSGAESLASFFDSSVSLSSYNSAQGVSTFFDSSLSEVHFLINFYADNTEKSAILSYPNTNLTSPILNTFGTAQDLIVSKDLTINKNSSSSIEGHIVGYVQDNDKDFTSWSITRFDRGGNNITTVKFYENSSAEPIFSGNSEASGVVTDSSGNVYITGYYEIADDFVDSSCPNQSLKKYLFVAKFFFDESDLAYEDGNGNEEPVWATYTDSDIEVSGSECNDEGISIEIDESQSPAILHVAGTTDGSIGNVSNFGGEDIFILQFDSSTGERVLDN